MWLPEAWCDLFEDAFGLRYVEETGRYLVDDEQHTELLQLEPTLTFTLGASTTGGTIGRFDLPYAAFDLEGEYPMFPNATRYFPIRRAANDTQYTIGRVFLQETYLTVDSERGIFNISQAKFSNPMPSADLVAIASLSDASSNTTIAGSQAAEDGISGGAIAGIVVGAVGSLLILAGVLLWWFRRRRRNQPRKWPDAEPAEQRAEDAPPPRYGGELIGSAANVPELSDGKARAETVTPASRHEAASATPLSEAGGREKYEAEGSTPFSEADGAQRFEAPGSTPITVYEAAGTPKFEAEGDTPMYEADRRPRHRVHEAEGSTPVYELPAG
ncbi:putative peptidase a1 [Diaporthe ampelina]|uniref:Putative peptidase a1 n=1 Tax=Diaporthe ampelina TaxID=1214573 RepID=A0A0G2FIP0_9PEZI|nr:putative peptidase a1 [Diaporthe ampelina]